MEIVEALKSLEKSWSRDDILIKIKNGEESDKILNDFFNNKKIEIETLSNFINPENKVLLSDIENLTNIELKLINKIKNNNFNKSPITKKEINKEISFQPEKSTSLKLSLFFMKWSNKFVFISLLVISAIALTKQAWA